VGVTLVDVVVVLRQSSPPTRWLV